MLRPYLAPPLPWALGGRIFRAVTTQPTCPSCRAEIPRGAAFCPACGSASPTVITNERAVVNPLSPAGRGGKGVRATPQGPAVPLGPKYNVRRLIARGGSTTWYDLGARVPDVGLASS